jgi:hypothetical protein
MERIGSRFGTNPHNGRRILSYTGTMERHKRGLFHVRMAILAILMVPKGCLTTHGSGARRQIASGDVGEDPASNQWVRNGMLLGAGGIPVDRLYWDNRMSLYDNVGNYKLSSDYTAKGVMGAGFAKNGVGLKYTLENTDGGNMDIINADTDANFWQGQDLADGMFAATVPGKPWIRQSTPFTCKDNPYGECKEDAAKCIANGCEKGKKVCRCINTHTYAHNTHARTHTHTHAHTRRDTHTYPHAHNHACKHTNVYVHQTVICMYVYCTYIFFAYSNARVHACIFIIMRTHMGVWTFARICCRHTLHTGLYA